MQVAKHFTDILKPFGKFTTESCAFERNRIMQEISLSLYHFLLLIHGFQVYKGLSLLSVLSNPREIDSRKIK